MSNMFLQYIPRFLSPQHINIYNFEVNSYAFNSFHVYGLFRYPLKTSGFLMISGGIERGQWHVCP